MNMNSRVFLAILVLIALSLYLPCVEGSNGYVDVSVSEAKTMMDSNHLLVVLDVRNQSEYDSGHIRNAKLIPVWELEARINELDENRETLVYCSIGVRSTTASQVLTAHGFNQVYNMIGGIMDWRAMDYHVYLRYSSIQEAINNASDRETIRISSGKYHEHLVVYKPLTLVGENRDTTIIDGDGTGTVVQVKVDNTSISELTLQGSGCGCAFRSGILLENSYNSTITGNIIKNNGFGIQLMYSSSCTVTSNKIFNNTHDGIYSYYLDSSVISGNNIINNTYSNQRGIRLYWTNGCKLTYNNLANNSHAIQLWKSNDNSFYHNNFITNIRQASLMECVGNSWDNGPYGGNYWSDYNGTDSYSGPNQDETGSDGIGDTPYIINKENKDNYPLMGTFSRFSVAEEEQNYHVNIISNSTVSDFDFGVIHNSENKTGVSFNVTGSNGTVGFCRVMVPRTLINEPYTVLVNGEEADTILLDISNGTHAYLYFTYNLSTKHVVIILEFPSAIILPLFTIVTLTTCVLMKYKYRRRKTRYL